MKPFATLSCDAQLLGIQTPWTTPHNPSPHEASLIMVYMDCSLSGRDEMKTSEQQPHTFQVQALL